MFDKWKAVTWSMFMVFGIWQSYRWYQSKSEELNDKENWWLSCPICSVMRSLDRIVCAATIRSHPCVREKRYLDKIEFEKQRKEAQRLASGLLDQIPGCKKKYGLSILLLAQPRNEIWDCLFLKTILPETKSCSISWTVSLQSGRVWTMKTCNTSNSWNPGRQNWIWCRQCDPVGENLLRQLAAFRNNRLRPRD